MVAAGLVVWSRGYRPCVKVLFIRCLVPPQRTNRLVESLRVHRLRGGFWIVWLGLCVLGGVQLHHLFRITQAPLFCRVGVLALVPQHPWDVHVIEQRGGLPDRLIVPHLLADHPESRWWNLRLTPLAHPDIADATAPPPPLRIESVAVENTALPLGVIASQTSGWRVVGERGGDPSSPIETTTGAPILLNAWSLWHRVLLARGPDAGRVRVEDLASGLIWEEDLRTPTPSWSPLERQGPREVVFEFDVPAIDPRRTQPIPISSMRLVERSGATAQILRAWSTLGSVQVRADRQGFEWIPPPLPWIPLPLLASVLVAGCVGVMPLLHWYRRRHLSPNAGCAFAIVVWSAGYAGLLLLLFAPGLTDPDTMFRAAESAAIVHGAPIAPSKWTTWHPPGKSLFMMVPGEALGAHTLFTFAQAWWLYASIGLLGLVACGRRCGAWLLLAVMLMPQVATHAASMSTDATITASLCTIAAILLWVRRFGTSLAGWQWGVCAAGWMISCLALLTFRANALTTLVVILPAIFWAGWRLSKLRCAGASGWALACAGLSLALPAWLGLRPLHVASASLVWEHVGMLKLAHDEDLTRRHSIDDMGRYTDATHKSIAVHDWFTHDQLIFGPTAPLARESVTDPAFRMPGRWWALVRERPLLYLRMKWEVAQLLLGMRRFVHITIQMPHDHPLLAYYGMNIRPSAPLAGRSWMYTTESGTPKAWEARTLTLWFEERSRWFMPLYLPFVWIALGVIATGLAMVRRVVSPTILLPLLLAGSYYGAFFLVTPGLHWRYFMPAFALLLVVIFAGVVASVRSWSSRSDPGWP
jgi:hypothetical protein